MTMPEIRYNPDADTVRREWTGPDAAFDPRDVPTTLTGSGVSWGFVAAVLVALAAGAAAVYWLA